MANIGKIAVQLQANAGPMLATISDAEKRMGGFSNTIRNLAMVAGAGAFTAWIRGAMETLDATGKLADKLGIAVEQLQALQVAADLAGSSGEELQKAMEMVNRRIGEVRGGSTEAAQAFAAIGLDRAAVEGMNAGEAFEEVARRISEMPNAADRAAAAVAVFGRNGQAMLPFLTEMGESVGQVREKLESFGAVLPRDAIRSIEEANDSISMMGQAFNGVRNQIAATTAPAITSIAETVQGMFVAAQPFIRGVAAAFGGIADIAAGAASVMASTLKPVLSAIGEGFETIVGIVKNLNNTMGGFLKHLAQGALIGWVMVKAVSAMRAAVIGLQTAILAASAATHGLKAALVSTGIGAIAVALGTILSFAISSGSAPAQEAHDFANGPEIPLPAPHRDDVNKLLMLERQAATRSQMVQDFGSSGGAGGLTGLHDALLKLEPVAAGSIDSVNALAKSFDDHLDKINQNVTALTLGADAAARYELMLRGATEQQIEQLGAAQQALNLAQALDDAKKIEASLAQQLRTVLGETNDQTQIRLLRERGLNDAQLESIQNLQELIRHTNLVNQAQEDLARDADRVRQSVVTPLEAFQNEMVRIDQLLENHNIGEANAMRARGNLFAQLSSSVSRLEATQNRAMERNSSEAFSTINAAQQDGRNNTEADILRRIEMNAREQRRVQERNAKAAEQLVRILIGGAPNP